MDAKKLRIEKVLVTPELAKKWLQLTKHNRKVNYKAVSEWVSIMVNEAWSPTASHLHFDTTGALIDGQHRLTAVMMFGSPVEMTVIYGCDPGDFLKMDTGRSRLAAQFIVGKYANERSVAARILYMVTRDGEFHARKIDVETLVQFAETWDGEMSAVAADCKGAARNAQLPTSTFMAVMAQALRNGTYATQIDEFLSGCSTGEGLYKGDARLALIKKGRSLDPAEMIPGEGKASLPYRFVARAWNAYAKGEKLHLFRNIEGQIPRVL